MLESSLFCSPPAAAADAATKSIDGVVRRRMDGEGDDNRSASRFFPRAAYESSPVTFLASEKTSPIRFFAGPVTHPTTC